MTAPRRHRPWAACAPEALEGEYADKVAVLGEEQVVQHEQAEYRTAHEHAQGDNQPRSRNQDNDEDEKEEGDIGESRHLSHEGEERVDPGTEGPRVAQYQR
jgi:hypothetical protein